MFKKLLAESDPKTIIILLLTPFLITTYKYLTVRANYDHLMVSGLSGCYLSGFYPDFFNFLLALILLMLIPGLIIKFVFREKLSQYGFKAGDLKFGLWSIIISLPLVVISAWLSSHQSDFQKEYSAFKNNPITIKSFIIYALAFFLYYLSFEFFFRGFMLQGLRNAFGSLNAILVQTIPCCLIHIGKPAAEIFASIIASLVFGYLVLRSRSLWYVIIIHWLIGTLLNLFIALS